MLDVLIRGGTVVDGSGAEAYSADVGIKHGRIVEIGRLSSAARHTLDADGAVLTPGFIDIHTHYDGQASWDETFSPSIYHGVTTVVMGNCGVGFAPLRPGQQQRLVELMEGVEEIPGAALSEGVRWGWESFEHYTQALDAMPHSLDFLTLVPHDPLRLYVMGERAANCEAASVEDCAAMSQLLRTSLVAGAIGFSTGRSDNHRTASGSPTPAHEADRQELNALAQAFHGLPYRVIHAVNDFDCMRSQAGTERERFEAEFSLMAEVARTAGRPLALSWLERINAPQQHHWLRQSAEQAQAQGIDIKLQTACRAIGVINGLDTSFNVLMAYLSYRELMHLPRDQRAQQLRDPSRRARLLAEAPLRLAGGHSAIPPLVDQLVGQLEQAAALMFPLNDEAQRGPNYEPNLADSFAARARQRGSSALAEIYDFLAQGDGDKLIYFPIFNYLGGSLDGIGAMLKHPQALLALSDAGAHVGTICDASLPTTLLSHWVRDRSHDRLSLPAAVALLSSRNARHLGLRDRGQIALGMKADLNVIDLLRLEAHMPSLVNDLPAGGRRFVQKASGYVATLCAGEVICSHGDISSARPGRWVRASDA